MQINKVEELEQKGQCVYDNRIPISTGIAKKKKSDHKAFNAAESKIPD